MPKYIAIICIAIIFQVEASSSILYKYLQWHLYLPITTVTLFFSLCILQSLSHCQLLFGFSAKFASSGCSPKLHLQSLF